MMINGFIYLALHAFTIKNECALQSRDVQYFLFVYVDIFHVGYARDFIYNVMDVCTV